MILLQFIELRMKLNKVSVYTIHMNDNQCEIMQKSIIDSNDVKMQQGKEKNHTITGSLFTLVQTR